MNDIEYNKPISEEKMNKFSLKHFTWINQIFGDRSVLSLVHNVYNNKRYKFTYRVDEEFGYHHRIWDNVKNTLRDSIEEDIQLGLNNTLCQSYALLLHQGYKWYDDNYKNQKNMIQMYRNLINNEKFLEFLNDDIITNELNNELWIDHASKNNKFITMDINYIIMKINNVLDEWDSYGHKYFDK